MSTRQNIRYSIFLLLFLLTFISSADSVLQLPVIGVTPYPRAYAHKSECIPASDDPNSALLPIDQILNTCLLNGMSFVEIDILVALDANNNTNLFITEDSGTLAGKTRGTFEEIYLKHVNQMVANGNKRIYKDANGNDIDQIVYFALNIENPDNTANTQIYKGHKYTIPCLTDCIKLVNDFFKANNKSVNRLDINETTKPLSVYLSGYNTANYNSSGIFTEPIYTTDSPVFENEIKNLSTGTRYIGIDGRYYMGYGYCLPYQSTPEYRQIFEITSGPVWSSEIKAGDLDVIIGKISENKLQLFRPWGYSASDWGNIISVDDADSIIISTTLDSARPCHLNQFLKQQDADK